MTEHLILWICPLGEAGGQVPCPGLSPYLLTCCSAQLCSQHTEVIHLQLPQAALDVVQDPWDPTLVLLEARHSAWGQGRGRICAPVSQLNPGLEGSGGGGQAGSHTHISESRSALAGVGGSFRAPGAASSCR